MSGQEQGAGDALCGAAIAALDGVAGLNGTYDGRPLRGAFPYAVVEAGPESDWSHKSGAGRELRLAVTVRDAGERPVRLRALVQAVQSAIGDIDGELEGWQVVTLVFLRSRMLREPGAGWAAAIDYRARMLKD
ncbi:MAG TPA: DUF3168 domain-containing protein [Allosphingosinicella sp.]|nr:DUF3168 domain-containing protein [Allosphingosinicella sp.]